MRHKMGHKKLGRNSTARRSLLINLAKATIENEQIITTEPKAKALRSFVDNIITLGKKGGLSRQRELFSILRDNELVSKVMNILAKRYETRNGGYLRVLKAGYRYGDTAKMAVAELVDRDVTAKGKKDREYLEAAKKETESK